MNERGEKVIRDILTRYREAGYFPSACVRIFNREETLLSVCTGEAQEDALFDVASLTKIATATLVLRLVAQGVWKLSMRLADLFSEVAQDAFLRDRIGFVTLEQLLTHTSGIVDWYPMYLFIGQDFFSAVKAALEKTQPVEGMVYSDLNYMLLGKALESAYGKPLEKCLQEELVQPLQLGEMLFCPSDKTKAVPTDYGNAIEMRMCAERNLHFDGFRPLGVPIQGDVQDGNSFYYFGGVAGHAGIFAQASAYERLCRFYMNTERPVFLAAQREQPHAPTRGLGFQVGPGYPHGCGHTGFTGTSIYFSREYNIGAVIMTNRLYYPFINEKATWDFRRALHEAAFALYGAF